jgi:Flp pilus assembly pilin Flp
VNRRSRRSEHRSRFQRGATFVEYAMLMGLFAAASTAGINVVNKESGEKVTSVSATVGELPRVQGSVPVSTVAVKVPATTAPPATTAAPATTSTSTTTTVKPTTTTSTTTSTTAAPPTTKAPTKGSVALPTPTAVKSSDDKTWTATTTLTVMDNNGTPVAGATGNVKIRTYTRGQSNSWQWQEKVVSYKTGADGKVVLSTDALQYTGGTGQVTKVEFVLESAQMPNNLPWDQSKSTVSADRP